MFKNNKGQSVKPFSKDKDPSLSNSSRLTSLLLALSIATGLLLVWRIPQWQVPAALLDIKVKAELENENRQTIIQALGGLFFLVTAGLTLKNLKLTEDKQVTERFSKAVEMLSSEDLEVTIGGIYTLERIAKDSKRDHPVVMEVLAAYIREKSLSKDCIDYLASHKKPRLDIQSALTVIGRRNIQNDQSRIDLSNSCLILANLMGAHLENAMLAHTSLQGALLGWAHFEGAFMWGTKFEGANMVGVHLEGADLLGADLKEALLLKTDLSRVKNLTEEQLSKAQICVDGLPEGINIRPDRDCSSLSMIPSLINKSKKDYSLAWEEGVAENT